MFSTDDLEAWKKNAVTTKLLEKLQTEADFLAGSVIGGSLLSSDNLTLNYGRAVGRMDILNVILSDAVFKDDEANSEVEV